MAKRATKRSVSRVAKNIMVSAPRRFRSWQIVLIVMLVAGIGIAVLRFSHASEDIDVIYHEVQDQQAAARSPKGALDGVGAPCRLNADGSRTGAVSGWGFDPTQPNASIQVHLYFDGPAGSGKGFPVQADQPSPDVNAAYGIAGQHRFNFPVPAQYYDGKQHTINAYSIGSSANTAIGQVNFTCTAAATPVATPPPPSATPPPATPPPFPTPVSTDPKLTNLTPQQRSERINSIVSSIMSSNKTASGAAQGKAAIATINNLLSQGLSTQELEQVNKAVDSITADQLPKVSGQTTLQLTLPANKPITNVAYYFNRHLKYNATSFPYYYNLDTTRLDNGLYRIDVVAFSGDTQVARYIYKINIQNNLSTWDKIRNVITYPWFVLLGQ